MHSDLDVSDILREISELPDGEVEGEIEWADAILSPSSEQFTGGLSVAQGSSAEGQSGSDSDDGEVSEFGNLPLSVAPKSLVTGLASDSEEGSSSCDNEPPPPRVGEAGSGRAKQGSSVQVEWLDSDDSVASSSDSEESRGTTQAVATEALVLPGAHVQGFRIQDRVSDHGLSAEVPAASETFLEDPPTQRIVLARELELVVPAAPPQENERSVAVLVGDSGLPEATEEEFGGCQGGKEEMLEMTGHPALGLAQREEQLPPTSSSAAERAGAVDATDLAHEERSSTPLELLGPSCITVKDPVPVSLPALSDDEAYDEALEHASELEADLSPPGLRSLQRGSSLADEMAQVGSSELLTTQAVATEASVLPGAHVQGFRVQETVSDHGLSVEVPAASETFLEDPPTQRIVLARESELVVPAAPPQENGRSVAVLVGDSGLPEAAPASERAGAVDATDLAHEKRSSTSLGLLDPSCTTVKDPVPVSLPALSDDEADDEDLEHASEREAPGEHAEEELSPPGLRSLQRGSSLADEMAQVGSSELLYLVDHASGFNKTERTLRTTQAVATEASVLPGAHVQGFRVQETVSDHGLSVEVPAASETFLEDPPTQRIVLARESELVVPVAPPQENERSVAVLVGDSGLPEGKEEEVGGCHGGKEVMLENLGLAQPGEQLPPTSSPAADRAGAVDATDLAHEKRSSTPLELLGPSCITANDPVPPSSPALSDDEAYDEDLEHASELEAGLSPPGLRSLQRGSSLADEMAQIGSSELLHLDSREWDPGRLVHLSVNATESDSDEESRAETTRSEDIFVRSARENVREAGETSQGVVSGLRAESSGLDDQAGVEDNSRECTTTGLAEASNPVPASLACDEGEVSPIIPLEPELSEALEADLQKWPQPKQGATCEASERVRSREKYIAELEDRLQAGEADAGRQQDLCTQLQQLSEAQRRRLSDAEEERDSLLLRLTEVEEMAERRGRTQQRLLDEARRRAAAAEDEHDLLQQQLVEAVEAKAQLQKLRSQMESLRRQLAAGEQAQEDMAEKLEAVQRQNELLLNAMSEISELEEQQGTEAPLFSPLQRHSPRALSLKARGEEHLRDDPVHAEGQTAISSMTCAPCISSGCARACATRSFARPSERSAAQWQKKRWKTLESCGAESVLVHVQPVGCGRNNVPLVALGAFRGPPGCQLPTRLPVDQVLLVVRMLGPRALLAGLAAGDMTSAAASFGGTSRRWDGDSGVLLASPPREGDKQEQRTCAALALRMAMQTAATDSGSVNCSPDRRRGDMCFQRWDVIGDERERFDKSPLTHWDTQDRADSSETDQVTDKAVKKEAGAEANENASTQQRHGEDGAKEQADADRTHKGYAVGAVLVTVFGFALVIVFLTRQHEEAQAKQMSTILLLNAERVKLILPKWAKKMGGSDAIPPGSKTDMPVLNEPLLGGGKAIPAAVEDGQDVPRQATVEVYLAPVSVQTQPQPLQQPQEVKEQPLAPVSVQTQPQPLQQPQEVKEQAKAALPVAQPQPLQQPQEVEEQPVAARPVAQAQPAVVVQQKPYAAAAQPVASKQPLSPSRSSTAQQLLIPRPKPQQLYRTLYETAAVAQPKAAAKQAAVPQPRAVQPPAQPSQQLLSPVRFSSTSQAPAAPKSSQAGPQPPRRA
ncbi:unnamed protein product [Polarella glacialis]|uniref:Uncharacterized protein n=1 Tax=Polarella glacialis TaxID=89957 RepID=A0A813IAP8_POLGL|nr:unnamed protein product [Polarella glacialis]